MAAGAPAGPPASPPPFRAAEERSGHCAVVDGHALFVWGGYVSIEENEVYLPNDELWVYDMDSGLWSVHQMEGELPPSMSGSCGACINGNLYIFGGFDDKGYSNRLYYVSLRTRNGTYLWKKVTDFKGQPPTPRDKLACWVYKDRLIYFGGYGCRKQNELSDAFDVHDAFWEGQIFWGWHNDVHVFDTRMQTWYQPSVKRGVPPQPRAAHSCAVLGNKGFVFGGRVLQTRMNDLHYLNLDTWSWSGKIQVTGEIPRDRSWHTLTPITDDKLFLFGGLSSDNAPLSDGWIYAVAANKWQQLKYLPKNRPSLESQGVMLRIGTYPVLHVDLSKKEKLVCSWLWHTACLGKEGEVMVFGGSKDDLHFMDTGHCSDLLIFQTQPYSLLRLSLDCIGKNAVLLENQISWLPSKLLEQVLDKITFWAAVNYRQGKKAEVEGQEQTDFS